MKMSIPDQPSTMHMTELNVQSKTYSNSLQFSVPSSTFALTFFIQDTRVGASALHPITQSKCRELPTVGNPLGINYDLLLESIQCTYSNMTKSVVPLLSEFKTAGGVRYNTLQQRYYDNLIEAGVEKMLGSESFDDFLKRGVMVHFSFNTDKDSRATEVQLRTKYSAEPVNCNMFCVAHYRKSVQYTTQNGLIVSVNTLEI